MLQMSSNVNNPISHAVSVCLNSDMPKCGLIACNVSLYRGTCLAWHFDAKDMAV